MYPLLISFELWGQVVEIQAYGFFMAVAVFVIVFLGLLSAARRGLPRRDTMSCLLIMSLAALIGARLLHVVINLGLYQREPQRVFSLQLTGFSLYGGLILAAISGIVTCRMLRLNIWRLADSTAPALGLGIAITRLGCFLNGCCFGKETSLPWGITFPAGSPAVLYQTYNNISDSLSFFFISPLPVHPTQLYELAAALAGAGLAVYLLRRQSVNGTAFLGFMIWFTAFRWFNYYLRVPPSTLSVSPKFYPVFYGLVELLLIGMLFKRHRVVAKDDNLDLTS